jgi:competence transcription factor ComK
MEVLDKKGLHFLIGKMKEKNEVWLNNKIKDLGTGTSVVSQLEISATVNNQRYYHIFDKVMKTDRYLVQVYDLEGNILYPKITKTRTSMILDFFGNEINDIHILVIGG